jgi:hypothetical protein
MYSLCRHIMPSSKPCGSPALKGTVFCYNHTKVRSTLAKVEPRTDPSGTHQPLPFVFSEDRAALQLNYSVVVNALNDQRINLQTANAFNRLLRSCAINLSHGPLTDPDHAVHEIALTPEGEEIAMPYRALEANQAQLGHDQDCPCQHCAAPQEEHHSDCRCSNCEQETDTSERNRRQSH